VKTETAGKFTFKFELMLTNGQNSGALGFKLSHASLDTVLFGILATLSAVSWSIKAADCSSTGDCNDGKTLTEAD